MQPARSRVDVVTPSESDVTKPEGDEAASQIAEQKVTVGTDEQMIPEAQSSKQTPPVEESLSKVATPQNVSVEGNEGKASKVQLSKQSNATDFESRGAAFIPDVLLGATEISPQYGVLGKNGNQTVAIDLNGCNTISLFGVQGFGKSYTLGVIAEMATTQAPGINVLPSPLATVIFHYHKSDAYEPEYADAIYPNQKQSEIDRLLSSIRRAP